MSIPRIWAALTASPIWRSRAPLATPARAISRWPSFSRGMPGGGGRRPSAKAYTGKNPYKQKERAEWEATRLEWVQRQIQAPLKDAAVMNPTRWRLYNQLQATGLPAEGRSGGRTKMQRATHTFPKEHYYYDALCVGASTPAAFTRLSAYVQVWSAKGRDTRQMRHGQIRFSHSVSKSAPAAFRFQNGRSGRGSGAPRQICRRMERTGVCSRYTRASGSFDMAAGGHRVAQGISYRHCLILQRQDGTMNKNREPSSDGRPLSSPCGRSLPKGRDDRSSPRLKVAAYRGLLVRCWKATSEGATG